MFSTSFSQHYVSVFVGFHPSQISEDSFYALADNDVKPLQDQNWNLKSSHFHLYYDPLVIPSYSLNEIKPFY